MLCCLLIGMLLAQVAAFFRRGRVWLGLGVRTAPAAASTLAGALWRRRGAVFVAVQVAVLAVVVLHREHLAHEVRSIVAAFEPAPSAGPVCSGEPVRAASAHPVSTQAS